MVDLVCCMWVSWVGYFLREESMVSLCLCHSHLDTPIPHRLAPPLPAACGQNSLAFSLCWLLTWSDGSAGCVMKYVQLLLSSELLPEFLSYCFACLFLLLSVFSFLFFAFSPAPLLPWAGIHRAIKGSWVGLWPFLDLSWVVLCRLCGCFLSMLTWTCSSCALVIWCQAKHRET